MGGSRRRRPVLHKPLPGPHLTAGRPRPRRQPAAEAHRVHYAAEGAACARTLPTLSGAGQPEWPAGANPRARPRSDWLWPCVPAATPASASAPSPPLSWILGWPRSPGTSVCVDSRPLAVHKRVRPRLTRVTESTLKQRLTVQPAPGPSEVQHGTTHVGSAISPCRTWTPRPPLLPSRRAARWSHAGAQVAHSARLPPSHPGPRTVIHHLSPSVPTRLAPAGPLLVGGWRAACVRVSRMPSTARELRALLRGGFRELVGGSQAERQGARLSPVAMPHMLSALHTELVGLETLNPRLRPRTQACLPSAPQKRESDVGLAHSPCQQGAGRRCTQGPRTGPRTGPRAAQRLQGRGKDRAKGPGEEPRQRETPTQVQPWGSFSWVRTLRPFPRTGGALRCWGGWE